MKNTRNGRKQNSSVSEKNVTNIMSPQHIFPPRAAFHFHHHHHPAPAAFKTLARARERVFARPIPSSRQKKKKASRGLLEAIPILGDKARQEGGGRAGAATLPPPSFSKPAEITHLFPRAVGLGRGVGKGLGAQFWQ